MAEPELLSISRMARRAGVPQAWLREMAEQDVIPALKASPKNGRPVYVFAPEVVKDVMARLASQMTSQNSKAMAALASQLTPVNGEAAAE